MFERPVNIDSKESILKGKLVFSRDFFGHFDRWFDGVISLIFVFGTLFLLLRADFDRANSNEKVVFLLGIPVIIFGLYFFYRIISELWLVQIKTNFGALDNTGLILRYAKKYECDVIRNSKGCIVLRSDYSFTGDPVSQKHFYIFILHETDIYYCSLKTGSRGNTPSLLHHWLILNDVKKLVKVRGKESSMFNV